MDKNFVKLKTKYKLAAILKSVIIAVSCGLLAVGAVMLPLKLCAINLFFVYYIIIGIGVAALTGGVFFFCLYKFTLSDKNIAKKLDKDYQLNERVQTLVAYGEEQGDIITLLREDTENRLGNLPKRNAGFFKILSAIWYYPVTVVLSSAMFVSAMCVPQRTKPTPEEPPIIDPILDPDFEYTLELQSLMYDLMRDVLNSNLRESEKNAFLAVLEDLDKQVLPTVEKKSQLDIAIKTAVYAIDGIIERVNSFRAVSLAVKEFDENLSNAIIQGVILYKTFNYSLIDLDMVKGLYNRVDANIDETVEKYFTASYNAIKFTPEAVEAGGRTLAHEYIDNLSSALSGLVEDGYEDDGLIEALGNFQSGIEDVCARFNNKGVTADDLNEGPTRSLKLAYSSNLSNSAVSALLVQSYNSIMNLYVRQQLAAIFEVSIRELGGIYDDLIPDGNTGGDNPENPDNPGGNGGYGSGDDLYGSKDLIYDVEMGEQVEYGTVFNDYYSKVDDRLQSGDLPQELVNFIEEYFKILLNGIEDDSSEEN